MVKFNFDTLTARSTTYDGPSGERYTFYLNGPTEVSNDEDVKFFDENPRFSRAGKNAKAKPADSADDSFRKKLLSLDGIGKKTADAIVDTFNTPAELTAHLDAGNNVDGVTAEQHETLVGAFAKAQR